MKKKKVISEWHYLQSGSFSMLANTQCKGDNLQSMCCMQKCNFIHRQKTTTTECNVPTQNKGKIKKKNMTGKRMADSEWTQINRRHPNQWICSPWGPVSIADD